MMDKVVENKIQIEHLFGYQEISGHKNYITVKVPLFYITITFLEL